MENQVILSRQEVEAFKELFYKKNFSYLFVRPEAIERAKDDIYNLLIKNPFNDQGLTTINLNRIPSAFLSRIRYTSFFRNEEPTTNEFLVQRFYLANERVFRNYLKGLLSFRVIRPDKVSEMVINVLNKLEKDYHIKTIYQNELLHDYYGHCRPELKVLGILYHYFTRLIKDPNNYSISSQLCNTRKQILKVYIDRYRQEDCYQYVYPLLKQCVSSNDETLSQSLCHITEKNVITNIERVCKLVDNKYFEFFDNDIIDKTTGEVVDLDAIDEYVRNNMTI